MTDSTGRPERLVSPTAGRQSWTKHAYEVLVETAGRYNAVIDYADLAEQVQQRSGLRTTASTGTWLPGVLSLVAYQCHRLADPALTALVIHKGGRVGGAYNEVLRIAGLQPIDDEDARELHAAGARLECYRRWGADVPADATAAMPALPSRGHRTTGHLSGQGPSTRTRGAHASSTGSRASRTATRPKAARTSTEARRGAICPTCFMEMPLAGPCPNCA